MVYRAYDKATLKHLDANASMNYPRSDYLLDIEEVLYVIISFGLEIFGKRYFHRTNKCTKILVLILNESIADVQNDQRSVQKPYETKSQAFQTGHSSRRGD